MGEAARSISFQRWVLAVAAGGTLEVAEQQLFRSPSRFRFGFLVCSGLLVPPQRLSWVTPAVHPDESRAMWHEEYSLKDLRRTGRRQPESRSVVCYSFRSIRITLALRQVQNRRQL